MGPATCHHHVTKSHMVTPSATLSPHTAPPKELRPFRPRKHHSPFSICPQRHDMTCHDQWLHCCALNEHPWQHHELQRRFTSEHRWFTSRGVWVTGWCPWEAASKKPVSARTLQHPVVPKCSNDDRPWNVSLYQPMSALHLGFVRPWRGSNPRRKCGIS